MARVLRNERVWAETFTGLRLEQFERLLKAVRDRGGNGTPRGRPWCLPLADRVLVVAVYYRTNLTMRRLGPLLALEPVSQPGDAADRLWVGDGTLITVRGRATVRIHTGQGRDTRTDLYQDRRHYVWDNHSDTATLRNDRGRFIDDESWGHDRHRGSRR
ncbi:hypothetical protein [Streptomyces sp. PU_AKi4]|uniref:hypothetical protein n=1 Tax=Streptomyces sp. PU_AKi4 TaxID=2800809 RepID=UPI003524A29A